MEYPTKEKFLASISSDMKLTKAVFLRIYGYEISHPGFAEIAIKELSNAGCGKAQTYYNQVVAEYEENQKESFRSAAEWLHNKIENDYDRQCKGVTREGSEDVRQNLLKQKRMLLMRLKENLQM